MELSDIISDLKIRIKENIASHDVVGCKLCDDLIKEANVHNDTESIAFAYIWKANYYFYVEPNRKMMLIQLNEAEKYINVNKPCDLLETYYTLFHLYYRSIMDHKTSLSYTLKALKVAKRIHDEQRISANLAIIGEFYLACGCYTEALYYLDKSLHILNHKNPNNYKTMRLILVSLFSCLMHEDKYDLAKEAMDYLSNLELAEVDLKVYVDCCQMIYHSYFKNAELTNRYASEMLKDGVSDFMNAELAFDFIASMFHSMMRIKNQNEAKNAIDLLKQLFHDEVYDEHLKIASFQIEYDKQFDHEKLAQSYKAYYCDFDIVWKHMEQLKVEGLNAKILLHDTALRHREISEEIRAMKDEVNVDELGNVFNRHFLYEKHNAIIQDESNKNIGYIMLDVDYFKEYNETYGHVLGDEVLRKIACILKDNCLLNMEVFRYDEDTFICVLWNSDITVMKSYIELVQSSLFELNLKHHNSLCSDRVTLSIGYGIHDLPMVDHLYSFIEEVGQALYHAKERGRDRAIALVYEEEVMKQENKYVSKSFPVLNLINDIKKIRFENLDVLKKKCDLLEALSEKNNDEYGEAFSHIYQAHYYQINQRDDDYKFHSDKARKLSEKNHFSDILIEYYKLSGIYYSDSGDELSSLSSLLLGLEIAMKAQDFGASIAFNNNIAEAFYLSKVSDKAEMYFLKALESASHMDGRPKYKDLVMVNLVDVFIQKKDIKQARYWFKKSREYGQDTSLTTAYLKRSEICLLVLENKTQEAFNKIIILRKDLENEEPMLFIQVYLYIMDALLEIQNKAYATWCLNILLSLENEVNALFKLQISTLRVKFSETFHMEDNDAYAKFYETTLYYEETQQNMNDDSLNDLIELYDTKLNQENITKRKECLQIPEKDSDSLTDVYNRRYFSKLLTKYMYDDNVNMLGIVKMDIDYFKEYNETYGHVQGDKVLKSVARVISDNLPEGIFLARFGGDEFACICINKKDEEIISMIEKIQAKVRQIRIEHKSHRSDKYITLSFGFCNEKERDNLLEKADDALFKAKSLGRNTYFPRLYKKGRELDKGYHEVMKEHDQEWFNDRYKEVLKHNQKYALIQVNIKNFRYYNTKYGFEEGDEILFLIHEAFINLLQENEFVTRIYADNYALLLKYDDIDVLVKERLQKSIDVIFRIEDPRIYRNVFLTYGIYEMNKKDVLFQEAWNNAGLVRREIAAPTQRSSCLGVYGQEHHHSFLDKIQLEVDTANAYKNYEFVPFYQPKVDAKTHEIVGAEALLRWYDDAGNQIPLYKFLPILNENSYINLIDLDIFEMSCKMLDERIKKGQPVVPISFNISKSYFYDPNIISDYINVFEKYSIPKHLIEIELMETISLDDTERLKSVIQGFKDYGFKCMLDDFGNGYSSFNVLLNNELYAVKLDRQFFVKNLNGDNKFMIKTVIDLIKSLNMKVVAEGVETKEYADFLAECGCDIIQGFYFYKPMPLKKFSTLLNQAR